MSRLKLKSVFLAVFVVILFSLFSSCAVRRLSPCLVGDPDVQVMTIQFVCPNVGASYETTVIKCPRDRRYRMDFICQLCGRHHSYGLEYIPYPYRWNDYYFYSGSWYSSDYWRRHWSYPPSYGRRPIRPPIYAPNRPPTRPPVRPPSRPPVRPEAGPIQDPRRSRDLRSPAPPPPRYTQPRQSASPAPRPDPIRVAPPARSSPPTRSAPPARNQSPRSSSRSR